MYVKSIRLNNFQSYFSDDNLLEFQEGLNIVIGNINRGKSKLFDAFYWVLFSEIYVTGENWINTDKLSNRSSFINDRAKFLTKPGDQIEAGVELVLCHNDGGNDSIEYTLRRTVDAKYVDGSLDWRNGSAWQVSNARVEITYIENLNSKYTENGKEFDDIVKRLFPKEIRNYVWFQGEALDKLINFSNKDTFEKAIQHISYYPKYEKLTEIMSQAVEIINKEKNKKIKEFTNDKKAYTALENDLQKKKDELIRYKSEILKLLKEEEDIKEVQESAQTSLSALLEFPPLDKKRSKIEGVLKEAVGKIDTAVDDQKQQFQKTWILKGMDKIMGQAMAKLQDFEQQLNNSEKYVLPADVPAKHYMEKMLSEGMCLVCGTDAKDGSDAHKYITARMHAQEAFYKQMKDNKELFGTVQQLMTFPDEVIYSVSDIDSQINILEDRIMEYIHKRNQANEELNEVKSEIDALMSKHKITFADAVNQSKIHMNKMSSMTSMLTDTRNRIVYKNKAIAEHEAAIINLQNKINNLSPNSEGSIPEMKWSVLTTHMQEIVKSVKDKAKSQLVLSIEAKANENYTAITKHNRAVDGRISINPATYKISRTDDGNYEAANPNTGNFTIMKMCIINAMLSLNEEFTGTMYPFIADAPTSNLDDNTTIAYVRSLAHAFGQSIIITKDIGKARLEEIKKDITIRTIHTLETWSEVSPEEELTQFNAYSKIERSK